MAGNLTVDRSSGYTASDLNTFFDNAVTTINGVLPNGIAIQFGNAFANISIADNNNLVSVFSASRVTNNDISASIMTPVDVLKAINYLGMNLSEQSNSTWVVGGFPVDSSTGIQSWEVLVASQSTEEEELAITEEQQDMATLFGESDIDTANTVQSMNIINQSTNKAEQLNSLGINDRLFQTTESMIAYILNNPAQNAAQNATTQVWNTNTLLQGQTVADKGLAEFGSFVNNFFSMFQVQPLSNSGGATWNQTAFSEETVDSSLSDKSDLPRLTRETFNDVSTGGWGPVPNPSVSALTTLTIETFEDSQGIINNIVGWFQNPRNNPRQVTIESFSKEWPEGRYPQRICSGSSSGDLEEITENISSQITGSATTFSLTNQYSSGSLRVYWNGQRQIVGETITELSNKTFSTTFVPLVGQYLIVDYVPSEQ
tara:strand:- start:1266 stop:2552 length:1287 start_codon:yes stop_codon:yes gene_type:complete